MTKFTWDEGDMWTACTPYMVLKLKQVEICDLQSSFLPCRVTGLLCCVRNFVAGANATMKTRIAVRLSALLLDVY